MVQDTWKQVLEIRVPPTASPSRCRRMAARLDQSAETMHLASTKKHTDEAIARSELVQAGARAERASRSARKNVRQNRVKNERAYMAALAEYSAQKAARAQQAGVMRARAHVAATRLRAEIANSCVDNAACRRAAAVKALQKKLQRKQESAEERRDKWLNSRVVGSKLMRHKYYRGVPPASPGPKCAAGAEVLHALAVGEKRLKAAAVVLRHERVVKEHRQAEAFHLLATRARTSADILSAAVLRDQMHYQAAEARQARRAAQRARVAAKEAKKRALRALIHEKLAAAGSRRAREVFMKASPRTRRSMQPTCQGAQRAAAGEAAADGFVLV